MVDTAIHIYDSEYPIAPTATFKPPAASVADYQKVCERRRDRAHDRGAADRLWHRQSLHAGGNRAIGPERTRGVAVVDLSVTDAELDRLTKVGIRGIRFFMMPGGVLLLGRCRQARAARHRTSAGTSICSSMAARFPNTKSVMKRWPGTLVIDHTGKFLEPVPVDHPGVKTIQRLLENGRTYVKLPAPTRPRKRARPITTTSARWPRHS